jgi:hypothetical protein
MTAAKTILATVAPADHTDDTTDDQGPRPLPTKERPHGHRRDHVG